MNSKLYLPSISGARTVTIALLGQFATIMLTAFFCDRDNYSRHLKANRNLPCRDAWLVAWIGFGRA
jgi:hypothetical protein